LRDLLGEDDENVLQDVVELFFENAPLALAEMQAALAPFGCTRGWPSPRMALKAVAGQFGATRLLECCAALEQAGRAGNLEPMVELLISAHSELRRVFTALEPERRLQIYENPDRRRRHPLPPKFLRLTLQALPPRSRGPRPMARAAWEMFDQDPVRWWSATG